MTTIALIPARGRSRRVPGKNTRLLNGKPLIQYTVEAAFLASEIDKVYVSTDDKQVAAIASSLGAEVIIRPEELATATASTLDVIKHAANKLNEDGEAADYLILLQPTVPFRKPSKIDEAIRILKETGCDSVTSLIRVDYFHPNRMKKIENGKVVPYSEPERENVSRDKLPEAYYRDGSIYAMKASLPLEKNTIFGDDVRAVINDREFFVNIDSERDWQIAEMIALRVFEGAKL